MPAGQDERAWVGTAADVAGRGGDEAPPIRCVSLASEEDGGVAAAAAAESDVVFERNLAGEGTKKDATFAEVMGLERAANLAMLGLSEHKATRVVP